MDDLHHNHLQLSLAELYSNERGISTLSNTLEQKQQAAAAKSDTLADCEQTFKTHKKEHGRLTREQQHIEKQIRYVCLCLREAYNRTVVLWLDPRESCM